MKKVVIITGASRGFGELIAKKFQKENENLKSENVKSEKVNSGHLSGQKVKRDANVESWT